MRETAFDGSDQHNDREFESLGAMNGHQGHAVSLLLGFVGAPLPAFLNHIANKAKEACHRVEPFCRSLQLVQHFLDHFLVLGQQLALIRFHIGVVEFLAHHCDSSCRTHGGQASDQLKPVFDFGELKVLQAG